MAQRFAPRGLRYNPPMLFNSVQYLIFLPLMVLAFWCLPQRFRPLALLIGSYIFYANWNPVYLLLIIGMTIFNWIYGWLIHKGGRLRTFWLVMAIITDVALLGYFKYTNFFLK